MKIQNVLLRGNSEMLKTHETSKNNVKLYMYNVVIYLHKTINYLTRTY